MTPTSGGDNGQVMQNADEGINLLLQQHFLQRY